MKKSVHCGKEYADEVVRCSIDGEILLDGESELLAASEGVAAPASQPPFLESLANEASSTPDRTWTDRQMRIFEVVLVCLIAFGGSLLLSANHIFNRTYAGSDNSTYGMLRWVNGLLHEVGCIGLLWCVLSRRFFSNSLNTAIPQKI
jgi:hypothetical protein